MSLGMIDSRNNAVLHSVAVPDVDNPHILPPPETTVWHYTRYEYFKKILETGMMRFTRLDKQSDKTDGNYSAENAFEYTPVTRELMNSIGFVETPQWKQLLYTNEVIRKKAYVHCWSLRKKESAWMWNSFLGAETRSIAICSTIKRLQIALQGHPVELQRIIYYPPGVPRPDWSYTAPFSAKDRVKYRDERELRLISVTEPEQSDESEFRLFKIDKNALVAKIVVHPLSAREFQKEVQHDLNRYGISVHVARSSLGACDLQAVAKRLP